MKKKQRLYFILLVLAALAGAVGLSLYALRGNISYFHSPRDIVAMRDVNDPRIAATRVFRLGGLVVDGSVKKSNKTPDVSFTVTDGDADIPVVYTGILPDLFREGQGVVATGSLRDDGVFAARELLAKHDENYMPPEVAKALKQGHEAGKKKLDAAEKAPAK